MKKQVKVNNHLLLPVSMVLTALILGGFYYATQVSKQNAIDESNKAEQERIQQQTLETENNYNECIKTAENDYSEKKDTYCKNIFYNLENYYKNCIVDKQKDHPIPLGSYMSSSDGVWRNPDGSPIKNYSLKEATELCKGEYNWSDNTTYNPNCSTVTLDKALETEKDRCVKLYK